MTCAVPFIIAEIYQGLAEAEGTLRLDDDFLYFDLQMKDAVFGVLKGDMVRVDVSLDAIREATFRPKLLVRKARLSIIPSDPRVLEAIPGSRKGEVVLHFHGKHANVAEELADRLDMLLTERQVARNAARRGYR
jgi:hypothetical protein